MDILKTIPTHPNVIEFKFSKKYEKYHLLGLEYAKDGTLVKLNRKTRKRAIEDDVASLIIKSILQGI